MKKNKETFASRARRIKSKYSRADFDKIERTDMINELKTLKEEQEEFRMENGMDDDEQGEAQEQANGGRIFNYSTSQWLKPRGGYTNYTNGGVPDLSKTNLEQLIGLNSMPQIDQLPLMAGLDKIKPNLAPSIIAPKLAGNANAQVKQWNGIQTSPTASAISTGVSLLGNIAGAVANNKKNRPGDTRLPRMSPTTANMEPQREALRRDYHNALNIALNRSRSASNESNAYANQIGAITGLTDSMGSKMNESALSEAQMNAGYQNQASQANLQIGAQEVMANKQQDQYYDSLQTAYRDAAFDAIPKGLQDYRAQYSQDLWMNTMGKEYGLQAQPYRNAWEKFIGMPRYNVARKPERQY
jgi:hypothetical protein